MVIFRPSSTFVSHFVHRASQQLRMSAISSQIKYGHYGIPTTNGFSLDVHSKSSLFNEHLAATDYYNASSEINSATDVPYGFFHHPLPGQSKLCRCVLDWSIHSTSLYFQCHDVEVLRYML